MTLGNTSNSTIRLRRCHFSQLPSVPVLTLISPVGTPRESSVQDGSTAKRLRAKFVQSRSSLQQTHTFIVSPAKLSSQQQDGTLDDLSFSCWCTLQLKYILSFNNLKFKLHLHNLLSQKDCVEISTHFAVYKIFYTKCSTQNV